MQLICMNIISLLLLGNCGYSPNGAGENLVWNQLPVFSALTGDWPVSLPDLLFHACAIWAQQHRQMLADTFTATC